MKDSIWVKVGIVLLAITATLGMLAMFWWLEKGV